MDGNRRIPPGAQLLKLKAAGQKFARKKSWVWDKIKNDPKFPKPIYLSPCAPVLVEQELDDYIQLRADESQTAPKTHLVACAKARRTLRRAGG